MKKINICCKLREGQYQIVFDLNPKANHANFEATDTIRQPMDIFSAAFLITVAIKRQFQQSSIFT